MRIRLTVWAILVMTAGVSVSPAAGVRHAGLDTEGRTLMADGDWVMQSTRTAVGSYLVRVRKEPGRTLSSCWCQAAGSALHNCRARISPATAIVLVDIVDTTNRRAVNDGFDLYCVGD